MNKTIYIDLDKVKTIADLKLIIRLQAGLASSLGVIKNWKKPRVIITGMESLQDTIKRMDHLIDHEKTFYEMNS